MPNWCDTSYVIEGSKRTLKKIKKVLDDSWNEMLILKENLAPRWEGSILSALNIKIKEHHHIRGFLETEPIMVNDTIRFHADEAWGRSDFAELLQKKFPSINIYWMAEEPGFEIYETNDENGIYFPDRILVEVRVNDNYEHEYFEDEESAYKWLSERYGIHNAKELEKFNENEDNHIWFNEFIISE